jgi:ribulose-phosphate 3-epimerase
MAGVAINPATPACAVEPLIGLADLILVMTVNPGWGGQGFISETLPKIESIRRMAPEVDIEVDGGVDPRVLQLVKSAGANVFVVGSWLARQTVLGEGMKELKGLCG